MQKDLHCRPRQSIPRFRRTRAYKGDRLSDFFLCFRLGALAGLGAFVRAGFLCVSVLGVASGPRVVGWL